MSKKSALELGLYVPTPIIEHNYIVDNEGNYITAYFKLESVQPSGSFKDRCYGHMVATLLRDGDISLLVTSSGGNAGLSLALIGQKLGISVRVYVPESTSLMRVRKIESVGAKVVIVGENWDITDPIAREAVAEIPGAQYIHPFESPLIWDGNSTIVDELFEALKGIPPDEIVLSVGGGGLLSGVSRGMDRVGWNKVIIRGVETVGAASFAAAKSANKVVKIDKIDTIATTLGSLSVTPATLNTSHATESIVVSDEQAVTAAYYFANEKRILVEPSCGAALSIVLLPELRKKYYSCNGSESERDCGSKKGKLLKRVVVIACGGNGVNIDLLHEWKRTYVESYENSIKELLCK